jgi:hypothetical protein
VESSPLEDGSTAFYDDSGNLLRIVSRDGDVTEADTSIGADFLRTINSTLGNAINRAFAVSPAAPAVVPAAPAPAAEVPSAVPAQQLAQQLVRYLPLLAGGFFLYRLLKR